MEIVRKRLPSGHLGRVVGTYISECWLVCLDGADRGFPVSSLEVAEADKKYYEGQGHRVEIKHIPEKFSAV